MIKNDQKITFEIKQVGFSRGLQKPLFSELNFLLKPSDLLLIQGPNGCGKSTLLRLLVGLMSPTKGVINWQGKAIRDSTSEFREHLHFLGHSNGLKLGLTVDENLKLICGHSANRQKQEAVLNKLHLANLLHVITRELSAGQKRKLALAKLWLNTKKLWILDEPLTSLDSKMQKLFLENLKHHLSLGGMAIISSHHYLDLDYKVQILNIPTFSHEPSCWDR